MDQALFGSELWKPALDKYAESTGLSVELFGADGQLVLNSAYSTPLVALFREYDFEPGLFAECASRCVMQTTDRPAVAVAEAHGLTVVGTSLMLEGLIVGAAVAGYALAHFSQVTSVQRWAQAAGVPFERLWEIVRRQAPLPQRRLMLHGELLQILGDALLRENYRTRQYEDAAQKLKAADAAKDEFLAMVSHELRTPLAPIAGWASVLKQSSDLEQVRRGAEAIERNALMESRIVDDLLDVSRMVRGSLQLDFEILELRALVRAAAENFAAEIEAKAIRLDFADAGDPLLVEGDAGRLAQAFRNVFSNAVKFTPAGGAIRVALGRDASNARVAVTDTGVGIASHFMPFVFDIFRQQEQGTRREHQGLGIGLSLVKKLVELHRGTVAVVSEGANRGTEVTVEIPLAAEKPELTEAAPAGGASSSLAGLSILLVEDSDDTRESVKDLLQLLGGTVSAARDGREALGMVFETDPDVVLCDLRMPVMDGYEFIRELQRVDPPGHPPVVAVSGFSSAADRQRTRDAGFAAYVKKPFGQTDLVSAIAAALASRPAS